MIWFHHVRRRNQIGHLIFQKKKKHKKKYSFGCSLSLVIQKGSDGISLKPFLDTDKAPPKVATNGKLA